MSKIFCVILFTCSLLLSGCRRHSQAYKKKPHKEKAYQMIKVENLTVTEKALMLDYQVSNPYEDNIWVCEDIDIYGNCDVETRIDAETVWIKLLSNLETNIWLEVAAFAKYRCLSPGEFHSGKILLNLPIRNASPVYDFDEDREKHKQVFLRRVVFEIGYFEGKYIDMISEAQRRFKRGRSSDEIQSTQFNPRIETTIQDGQSYKFLYCKNYWPGLNKEKTAKVIVTDYNIPCYVVVNNQ